MRRRGSCALPVHVHVVRTEVEGDEELEDKSALRVRGREEAEQARRRASRRFR